MTFELLPVLDLMMDFYQKPIGNNRFQEYLKILRGNTKDDLVMPISGFNPMAKDHVFDKLVALKTLDVERVMRDVLDRLNEKMKGKNERNFKVVFNVCDDLLGGWTNRYTTDFDSKFKINALINRQFCTPIFWSSEPYNVDLIKQRTIEYALRTIHWLEKSKPLSLREHVEQEQFVIQNSTVFKQIPQLEKYKEFYLEHSESDNYLLIFNFFYGDEASQLLGFPIFEK
jgi:hypothetical protein